jgi:NAD(P)-dependent dehydrogenase (short-subunit alcohol dehydrogenase family)
VDRELSGKVAFVSGSGRGLGSFAAKKLAQMGADLVVHDLSLTEPGNAGEAPSLDEVVKSVEALGVRAMGVVGNIGDRNAVAAMRREIEGKFGPVDILVNVAGGDIGASGGKPVPNNILGIPYEDIVALTNNNLIGTMLMTQAFVPQMVERQSGIVVNFASSAAHEGLSHGGIYATLKAAIAHYTRCLAAEVREHGVRVNAISPGPTKTARFIATRTVDPEKMNSNQPTLDRYGEPEEIAEGVGFLCSHAARFIHGQILRIDGGIGLFAG